MADNIEKIFSPPVTTEGNREAAASLEINKESAILADRGNGNLAENLKIFETAEGIKVFAATDRGAGREINEDRIVIDPQRGQFTILDGMMNAEAAQILAEKILKNPGKPDKAVAEAKSELIIQKVYGGVCLISAQLMPEKILRVDQAGDCGAMVFGAGGEIKFMAMSQVKFRTSTLEVDMKDFGIERTSQKLIDTTPRDFISGTSGELYAYDDIQLAAGDTVMLFSDPIWCNFSQREISQLVSQNSDPCLMFNKIAEQLRRKMHASENIFSGKKDEIFPSLKERARCFYDTDFVPQSDNQSLIIFKV